MNNVVAAARDVRRAADMYNFTEVGSVYCVCDWANTANADFSNHTMRDKPFFLFDEIHRAVLGHDAHHHEKSAEFSVECNSRNANHNIKAADAPSNQQNNRIKYFTACCARYTKGVVFRVCVNHDEFFHMARGAAHHAVFALHSPHDMLSSIINAAEVCQSIRHVSVDYTRRRGGAHGTSESAVSQRVWNRVRGQLADKGFEPYNMWHFSLGTKHASRYLQSVYALQNYCGLCCGFDCAENQHGKCRTCDEAVSVCEYDNVMYMGRHRLGERINHMKWEALASNEEFAVRVRQGAHTERGVVLPRRLQNDANKLLLQQYGLVQYDAAHDNDLPENVGCEWWKRDTVLWYNTIK